MNTFCPCATFKLEWLTEKTSNSKNCTACDVTPLLFSLFSVAGLSHLASTHRSDLSNLESQLNCLQPLPPTDLLLHPIPTPSSFDPALTPHVMTSLADDTRLMELSRQDIRQSAASVSDARLKLPLSQHSNVFAFPPVTSELNRTPSTSYPLLSPHSLIQGSSVVTSASHTFLPSSPTFAGVYPPPAPSGFGAGQVLPHQYVQTHEGRTLELLGAGSGQAFDPNLRHASSNPPAGQQMTSSSFENLSGDRKPNVKPEAQSFDVWRPHV